jgi:hypothetical protein
VQRMPVLSHSGSVLAIRGFHLSHDGRDGGRVELRALHQGNGALDVIGVDRVEKIFGPTDFGQSLEHERALEVALVHVRAVSFIAPPCALRKPFCARPGEPAE